MDLAQQLVAAIENSPLAAVLHLEFDSDDRGAAHPSASRRVLVHTAAGEIGAPIGELLALWRGVVEAGR